MSDIFRFEDGAFRKKAGSLRQISAGNSTAVWGVDDQSSVFIWNGEAFQVLFSLHRVPSLDLVRVAETGEVWGIDTDENIEFFDPKKGFQRITVDGAQFRNIVAGSSFAWAITDSQTFLFEHDGTFKRFDLALKTISCGPDSNPWGINAQNDVFFFDVDKRQFTKQDGISLDAISVGASLPGRKELEVWGLKARNDPTSVIQQHDIFRAVLTGHDEPLFAFEQVAGELMIVSAATGGNVWGINANHQAFQFDGQQFAPRDPATQLTAISVGPGPGTDSVWGLATSQPPPH